VPNVQWRTHDDGKRNCPKHVEFLDKNKCGKISASLGFIKKKFVTIQGHINIKFIYGCFVDHFLLPASTLSKRSASELDLLRNNVSELTF
jgi:hypothetical protein